MINSSATAAIKRAQKESLLLREFSNMYHTIAMDDSRLNGLFVNRVELSTDKGWVTVFFFTLDGLEKFQEQLEILKLYKPSIRKGLSSGIRGRYVPDIKFAYDAKFEKQQRLELAMAQAAQDVERLERLEKQKDIKDDEDAA
ncbi:ribosome-binding factor A [Candidatus Babeliales bacterium]|nr:ribosome-binding factor A [Candidatus Babeliales bacterium]MBP9844180.1 ribosome-binding factor A [Candidatus Babeliales bacterium]